MVVSGHSLKLVSRTISAPASVAAQVAPQSGAFFAGDD